MQGEFVTDRPTVDVEFAKAAGIYLDLSRSVTLINADGKTLCEMASTGAFQRAISEDGQWLAFMHIASVDVWRVDDLLRNCASTQGGL